MKILKFAIFALIRSITLPVIVKVKLNKIPATKNKDRKIKIFKISNCLVKKTNKDDYHEEILQSLLATVTTTVR